MKVEYNDIVVVNTEPEKGRIGIYDDDANGEKLIIYFGDPMLSMFINKHHCEIPRGNLAIATIDDLINRREEITKILCDVNAKRSKNDKQIIELLLEYNLIQTSLHERDREMKYERPIEGSKRIFIAHSSADKVFARRLANDLKTIYGLDPWFDEIKIKAGESILQKIQEGIYDCDYMLVLLSQDSIKSRWVINEYSSKLWDEIEKNKVCVIPILINKCEIPQLLKHKKYISFAEQSYSYALEEIIDSI